MPSRTIGKLQLSPVMVTKADVYQCYLRHTHLHDEYTWDAVQEEELIYYILEKHAKRRVNGNGGLINSEKGLEYANKNT